MKGFIVRGFDASRRFWITLFAFAVACSPWGVCPAAGAELADELKAMLSSPKIGQMRVGAQIVALDAQPRILCELNSDMALKPASTQKILTTAAVMALLPADFKFRTVLGVRGRDLVVIGAGDPAFGDPELARAAKQTVTAVFHEWADKLKAAGITRIEGDLLFDDFIFEQQFINPSWNEQFKNQMQSWYVAPVGGLTLNDNCIDVIVKPGGSVGSPADVTVIPSSSYVKVVNTCRTAKKGEPAAHRTGDNPMVLTVSGVVSRPGDPRNPMNLTVGDPGMFFACSLRTVLAAEGISVEGQTKRQRVRAADNSIPADLRVVAVHDQTIPDILLRCNKDSQNLFAEMLLKALGAYAGAAPGKPRVGSYESGRQVIKSFLTQLKLDADKCVIDDGSGLSHSNRTTAGVLAGVLTYMDRHPRQKEWISDMAEPGEDGTLRKRMKELKGKDRIFAKTGHITGVSALSGYVIGANNRRYAFAIICNDVNRAKMSPHDLQDGICRRLAAWTGN